MEMQSLVRNGVLLRLPPGFRFHPTDEELVVQYLRRKVLALPLPASVIPQLDLTKYNPWDLPGWSTGERYFFNLNYMRRRNRPAGCGYWRATGKEKAVVGGGRVVVETKNTLVFYQGNGLNGRRTEWVMHEYRLAGAGEIGCSAVFLPRGELQLWMGTRMVLGVKPLSIRQLKTSSPPNTDQQIRSIAAERP